MKPSLVSLLGIAAVGSVPLLAQVQNHYIGANVTGQMVLTATVNLSHIASSASLLGAGVYPEVKVSPTLSKFPGAKAAALAVPGMKSMPVTTAGLFGFNGLTHRDQRLANNGNQFSVEPPSPSIAVGNGYILEGVNNAVEVYNTAGTPLLPMVLATNQVFGLGPALNRATGDYGVFPTDIRVFYDQSISRWFILQRSQDNDINGNNLDSSHLYIAVSQTADPTQTYNVYTINTTNGSHFRCPCIADYPQIGADQYGFYISANEYDTFFNSFVDAEIFAISKTALMNGSIAPGMAQFTIPFNSGYEFAIQPATTPPGASYFLTNGGVEYFVSSQARFLPDSNLALWAMSNTASLNATTPNLALTQTTVPALPYASPDIVRQRPGPLPYGSSLTPPASLAFLDGGDTRVLSVSYAGGRLYTTLASLVTDEASTILSGGVYNIMSPALRNGLLMGSTLRQGYLLVKNNSLLRPALAVNAQGKGAITFTLVGPDYFPSAAFIPIDTFSTGSAVGIVAPGTAPEDGFTGYDGGNVARWGDYSSAVAASDGSIWMSTEYIPNLPRTPLANWGSFVFRYIP